MVLSSSSTSTRTSVTLLHWSQALMPRFISHSQTSMQQTVQLRDDLRKYLKWKGMHMRETHRLGCVEAIIYKVFRDMWKQLAKPVLDALGYNLVRCLSHSPIVQLCLITLISLDHQVNPMFGGVPPVLLHTFLSMLPVSTLQKRFMQDLVFLTSLFPHTLLPLAPL